MTRTPKPAKTKKTGLYDAMVNTPPLETGPDEPPDVNADFYRGPEKKSRDRLAED